MRLAYAAVGNTHITDLVVGTDSVATVRSAFAAIDSTAFAGLIDPADSIATIGRRAFPTVGRTDVAVLLAIALGVATSGIGRARAAVARAGHAGLRDETLRVSANSRQGAVVAAPVFFDIVAVVAVLAGVLRPIAAPACALAQALADTQGAHKDAGVQPHVHGIADNDDHGV
jgi:hypothetical protein